MAARAFERSGLQATVLEVHKAHLNQPLHVPGLRSELSPLLGLKEGRPDLLIGLGIEDLTVVQTAVGRRANEGGVAVSGLAPASIPRRIPRRSRPTAHTAGSR